MKSWLTNSTVDQLDDFDRFTVGNNGPFLFTGQVTSTPVVIPLFNPATYYVRVSANSATYLMNLRAPSRSTAPAMPRETRTTQVSPLQERSCGGHV